MLEANKAIWLDDEGYWNYGSNQTYVDFPVRFPTVTIALEGTMPFTKIVDAMRMEAGYKPMLPPDGWTEEMGYDCFDSDGWYNYYVTLNGFNDTMVDNCIEAVVQSEWADDNEQSYCIPLTEAEQIAVYNEIDKQLISRFGTSCDELLEEARQEMIELEEYRAKHKEISDGNAKVWGKVLE